MPGTQLPLQLPLQLLISLPLPLPHPYFYPHPLPYPFPFPPVSILPLTLLPLTRTRNLSLTRTLYKLPPTLNLPLKPIIMPLKPTGAYEAHRRRASAEGSGHDYRRDRLSGTHLLPV
jgi:hypothetical protein